MNKIENITSLVSFMVGLMFGMTFQIPLITVGIMLCSLIAIIILRTQIIPKEKIKTRAQEELLKVIASPPEKKIKVTTTFPENWVEPKSSYKDKISEEKVDRVISYFDEETFLVKDFVPREQQKYDSYFSTFGNINRLPTKTEFLNWEKQYNG